MKNLIVILILFFSAAYSSSLMAQSPTGQTPVHVESDQAMEARHRTLDPHYQQALSSRELRQIEYERAIDSAIMTSNYRFKPDSFFLSPAGSTRFIYNPACELAFRGDHADIFLPFYRGLTPPYRLIMLNTIILDLSDYQAVPTEDGWDISFTTALYATDRYRFEMTVYSKTGNADLRITSQYNNTVVYSGTIMQVY